MPRALGTIPATGSGLAPAPEPGSPCGRCQRISGPRDARVCLQAAARGDGLGRRPQQARGDQQLCWPSHLVRLPSDAAQHAAWDRRHRRTGSRHDVATPTLSVRDDRHQGSRPARARRRGDLACRHEPRGSVAPTWPPRIPCAPGRRNAENVAVSLPDHIWARTMDWVTPSDDKLPLHSIRLREHRLERDYSYEEAAARLRRLSREAEDETEAGTTAQRVWSWEHGAYPQARHRRLLCQLYAVSAEELGFRPARDSVTPSAKAGVRRREWLPGEDVNTATVDDSDPSDVSTEFAAIAAFRAADGQVGGGHMYATVATYLRTQIAPRVFHIDAARDGAPMFNAAAAFTEMAGWMAFDAGRNAVAGRCFDRALVLARVGDNGQLVAHVLAGMSHMAHSLDEPGRAIDLAREAQATARSGPQNQRLNALLLTREARGFAAVGDSRECARLLLGAERLLDGATERVTSAWISPFDQASLAGESATCLYQLGDTARAQREAERVLVLRRDSRARSRAFAQLIVAAALADRGALDEACAVGTKVLDGTAALGSFRVLQQFVGLRRTLDGHRSTPTVADFLVHLESAIRERGWLRTWDHAGEPKGPL